MRLSQIKKSPLYAIIEQNKAIEFAKGSNTIIFSKWDGATPSLFLISNDSSKYEYYKYALQCGFCYIPKIYSLIHDETNCIYLIHRECCNPITRFNKITRMNKIRYELQHDMCNDKISNEIKQFYMNADVEYLYQYDFGSHWLMQTDRGKMVVCDAFRKD